MIACQGENALTGDCCRPATGWLYVIWRTGEHWRAAYCDMCRPSPDVWREYHPRCTQYAWVGIDHPAEAD